jgi:hypothetical protein
MSTLPALRAPLQNGFIEFNGNDAFGARKVIAGEAKGPFFQTAGTEKPSANSYQPRLGG